jgi:hypothetical protein
MKPNLFAVAFAVAVALGVTVVAVAQQQQISPGSKVYIEPMSGFETYIIAAFEKKKVPLTVVSDESLADYVVTGNAEHLKAGWAKMVFMGNIHSDEQASVSMVSTKTKEVVFAYAVNKKNTLHGQQTSAEACAKHLKEKIETGKD